MIEILQTLVVSTIPALIAGVASFLVSKKKAESEINNLQMQNKNDLDKLLEQHKIDLESLKASHNLELEQKDCDHKHQIEIIQLNHQNDLQRKSKELEDMAKYQATNSIASELFPQLLTMILDNPEVKRELEIQLTQSLHQK